LARWEAWSPLASRLLDGFSGMERVVEPASGPPAGPEADRTSPEPSANGPRETPLLKAALAGDEAALDALLREQLPHVYRFGRRICRDHADAQDVLQDTLWAAARGLRAFRGASSLSTWLYAIARSFCIKKRRKSVFAPELIALDSRGAESARRAADSGPDPETQLSEVELAAAIASALSSLRPAQREAFILAEVQGLSPAEAARVSGLGVAAFKSRLHRARAELRAQLAPLLAHSRLAGH
jgi:RNA polymerase sigma-70 factor (ECF subfamily)